MHTARIVFCIALFSLASQAGAEDTPYQHEYLNGGYFEGEPAAGNPARSDDDSVASMEAASPQNGGPSERIIVADDCN